ncbi:MAG: hypothetical protein ABIF87_03675 [Pseudomonadota bacterium]
MSNADDLRRLAEEVKSAYEQRVNLRSDIKERISAIKEETAASRQNTIELISNINSAHKEMGAELRAELGKFMSELNAAESERQASADEDKNQRVAGKNQRSADVGRLRKDTVRLMHDMQKAHKEMGDSLRDSLGEFISDLNAAESERKATTRDFMAAIQTEISNTASAWKELIASMQTSRGAPVKTAKIKKEVAVEAKEAVEELAEEEAEEPIEELTEKTEELTEKIEEREQLRSRVISIVNDNPDGIKMTKIAEILGVENWRSLIPIMRQLVDEDELEKEGPLYFK